MQIYVEIKISKTVWKCVIQYMSVNADIEFQIYISLFGRVRAINVLSIIAIQS